MKSKAILLNMYCRMFYVFKKKRYRIGIIYPVIYFNTLRTGSFKWFKRPSPGFFNNFNLLNAELNPICYLLALLAHHFLHVSKIMVKSLILRLLMLYIYIYMEHLFLMFLDHTQRRSTVGRTPLDE